MNLINILRELLANLYKLSSECRCVINMIMFHEVSFEKDCCAFILLKCFEKDEQY